MNINALGANGAGMDSPATIASQKQVAKAPQRGGDSNRDPAPRQAEMEQMAKERNSSFDSMKVSLRYTVYGENKQKIALKVVNKDTGETIREIPPNEMQSLQAKIGELVGLIFNRKA